MFPVLLRLGPFGLFGHEVGPFTLHTYGVLVALGFVVALIVLLRGARRAGLATEPVLDLAFIAMLGAIVGSRLLYVLFNLREYAAEPLRALKIWEGGLVFHGGLLLALPLCLLAVRRSGLPAWEVADLFAPAIAIGQAVGRVGCFAAGCCYGAPWEPPLCVTFTHPESLAPRNVPLFPAQLLAAGAGLLVFAALLAYRPHRRAPGQVFWLYLLLAAVARLGEDAFRGAEAKLALLPWLSATQAISLALALAALALFVGFGRRGSRLTLPR